MRFRKSLVVRSLVLRHPKHIQGSYDYDPAPRKLCCSSERFLPWICFQVERSFLLPGCGSNRRWYKAFLVSFGARQRLAACDSSPGGCRKPGTYYRYQMEARGLGISQAPSPISGLERSSWAKMPWVAGRLQSSPTNVIWWEQERKSRSPSCPRRRPSGL